MKPTIQELEAIMQEDGRKNVNILPDGTIEVDGKAQYPELLIHRLHPEVKLPIRANEEAIGFDVYAFLLTESGRPSRRLISRMNTVAIPTGLVIRPPKGYYVQVCSRSGLAMKAVFVANAPGVIDPDYSGELMILLFNGGYEAFYVEHSFRIAQIILTQSSPCSILESSSPLVPHGRGTSGLGSTGA